MAEEGSSLKSPPLRTSTASPTPGIRRVQTFGGDESSQFRPRSANRLSTGSNSDAPPIGIRRRSSNFSDYSLNEARRQFQSSTDDLLLPKPSGGRHASAPPSHWHSAPLAFALLPAVGGMLFKNGSSVVTDIMILGLAAIFLNWSVRLPWDWYHSAQEIRQKEEYNGDTIIDDEADDEEALETSQILDDVPEDEPAPDQDNPKPKQVRRLPGHEAASNELYAHELMALLSCFIFPMLGAWLLHAIRSSLSRPSEGLVSNYNLTIFLLASELRPMSHLVKLIQARTLHLQRIVNTNPYDSVAGEPTGEVGDLKRRLEELEARDFGGQPQDGPAEATITGKQTALLTTEIRRTLQPELDSLNRAVRRYEKRLATQTMQTESRILDLEARLADAITLAAAAAKGHRSSHGFGTILVEWVAAGVVLPLQALGALASLPFRTLATVIEWTKKKVIGGQPVARDRKSTNGRSSHSRSSTDRLQGKASRR